MKFQLEEVSKEGPTWVFGSTTNRISKSFIGSRTFEICDFKFFFGFFPQQFVAPNQLQIKKYHSVELLKNRFESN